MLDVVEAAASVDVTDAIVVIFDVISSWSVVLADGVDSILLNPAAVIAVVAVT